MTDIKTPSFLQSRKSRRLLALIITVLVIVITGMVYLRFAWNKYDDIAKAETLQLAQSVKSILHNEHIFSLEADSIGEPGFALIEQSLAQLVESTDSIYYAYILKEQNKQVIIAVDSAEAKSPTSSPAKNSIEEIIRGETFGKGISSISDSIITSDGDWISALVPVNHPYDDSVVAVLGLNFSSTEWQAGLFKRLRPDIILLAFLILLISLLFYLRHKNLRLQESSKELEFQETLYRNVFTQAPIGIILASSKKLLTESKYVSINPMGEAIVGRNIDDLQGVDWPEYTHPDDLAKELDLYERFIKGEINKYAIEKRIVKPDGSWVWINITVSDFAGNQAYKSMYLCLVEDISNRKESEESLKESERSKAVFFSQLPGMAYRSLFDEDWTMEFISEGFRNLTGYDVKRVLKNGDITFNEIIAPEHREAVRVEWNKALEQGKQFQHEYEIITASGELKWVFEVGQALFDKDNNVEALEGIVLDISEKRKKEHQIEYLQSHDSLTGLYNLKQLESEKLRLDTPEYLPLSIAYCDIDGLRVINDAYGHDKGDQHIIKTGRLIQSCLANNHILGYTGGGGFLILMPNTDSKTAHRIKNDIKDTIDSYNKYNAKDYYAISISIGHSTKTSSDEKIQDISKDAENYLKRRKLLNQNSSHSAIVSAIMASLYAKSQETEQHGQRLGIICRKIGEELGLEQSDLDDLQLLSKLHDIGKIGIADYILNKPGALTEDEWSIMRQHPEIGYRIAMATPQLEHIADYILYHHERWDGKGYPTGLKGDEIPLISRILAIADAFDAMTEDRIYRKALTKKMAIEEIKRNAGTQFDPNIAALFIGVISNADL